MDSPHAGPHLRGMDNSAIDRFLACRRLALVGVSRDPKDFSRAVLRAFRERGYAVVPVNPAGEEIDGLRCHAYVGDVRPPVEAALLMTPSGRSAAAVDDCLRAGVRKIWLHRGVGEGAVSAKAVAIARAAGADLVAGECPFMYLRDASLPHRIHRFFRRLGRRAA
jgi:predicted CoA-binding protein